MQFADNKNNIGEIQCTEKMQAFCLHEAKLD